MILRNVRSLSSGLVAAGILAACTTYLAGPSSPNSSLVIGRIVVDNKFPGEFRLLPLGVLDKGVDVELESLDGKQYFKVTTEEQGYFLVPNLPPEAYHVLGVIFEGRRNDGAAERLRPRLRRPTFKPVPGTVTYVGSLFLDISERGESKVRELREDEQAKSYFRQKHGTSPWGTREFVSVSPGATAASTVPDTKKSMVESKPGVRTDAKAERPEWRVGDEWRFAWKRPGTNGTLTREVAREDTFEGTQVYVIRSGKNEYMYTKATLGLLADVQNGRLNVRRTPAFEFFSWPLEIGKEWRSTYLYENLAEKSSENHDFRMVVSGVERVQVPAGIFDAYKINAYQFYSGALAAEYWYSPDTKWFVRMRIHRQDGVREDELISFKPE